MFWHNPAYGPLGLANNNSQDSIPRLYYRLGFWLKLILIIIALGSLVIVVVNISTDLKEVEDVSSMHKLPLEKLLKNLYDQASINIRNSDTQNEIIQKIVKAKKSPSVMITSLQFRLFQRLDDRKKLTKFEEMLFDIIYDNLFDWALTDDVTDFIRQGKIHQRGIVMTTGKKMLPFAVHAIKSIRLWNCTLPVEVFYNGPKDLPNEAVKALEKLKGVSVIDINQEIDTKSLKLKGWDLKPFSMLVSSFQQVLLIDADIVFAQSPDKLFKIEEYQKTGALFFADRHIKLAPHINYPSWFRRIIPEPHSEALRSSAMFKGLTNYEQESGVVLIDKARGLNGLLAACLLNRPEERKEIQTHTWGEKETFWLGFEIAGLLYKFLNEHAGNIGVATKNIHTGEVILCGHVAHFDKKNKLLWFNDGIVEDKRANKFEPGRFLHVSNEGRWVGVCLVASALGPVDAEQAVMINNMKKLWSKDLLA